jgi:hypothetical protein
VNKTPLAFYCTGDPYNTYYIFLNILKVHITVEYFFLFAIPEENLDT